MNFDVLPDTYRSTQISRIRNSLERIAARSDNISAGRVIPSDGDLPIGTGRRLDAAVMFLDISKFSRRPSETETEQASMLRMLTFFFSEVISIVNDYGGTVEKNTGDGLMAYFVSPPGEKASTQQIAVAAALTIFYAADNIINPHIQASGLTKFDFRICIDHGAITVADVGVARGFRGVVAIGTTANVASKMLAVAEANTLLLGDQVLKGLPPDWSRYAKIKTANTGWIYRSTGLPYPFWEYSGRWKVNGNG